MTYKAMIWVWVDDYIEWAVGTGRITTQEVLSLEAAHPEDYYYEVPEDIQHSVNAYQESLNVN